MTKSFTPSMNLTDIFSYNKNLHIPTFKKNSVSTTYDTNFGKHYNKDFSKKVNFNDDSKNLINNTILFDKDFHKKDNTNELTNTINQSKSEMTEINPQYKYRFPQYTENQFKLMQWQTQEGTPNELNQRLRSDVNDENIEDIKRDDDSFESGLQTLRDNMRSKRNQLYEDYKKAQQLIKDTFLAQLKVKALQSIRNFSTQMKQQKKEPTSLDSQINEKFIAILKLKMLVYMDL